MGTGTLVTTYQYKGKSGTRRIYSPYTHIPQVDVRTITGNDSASLPETTIAFPVYAYNVTAESQVTRSGSSTKTNTTYAITLYFHEGSYIGPYIDVYEGTRSRSYSKALATTTPVLFGTVSGIKLTKPVGAAKTIYVTATLTITATGVSSSSDHTVEDINVGTISLNPRTHTRINFIKNSTHDDDVSLSSSTSNKLIGSDFYSTYASTATDNTGEYKFTGWYYDAACTQKVTYPFTVPEASPLSLYAGWKPNTGPTIKVKVNGEWEEGELKAKVNGEWVDADAAYVKVNGAWIEIN